jgi:hypothetical protein
MATGGPAAQARAEDASSEFVAEVQRELSLAPGGVHVWNAFVNSRGDRDAAETGLARPTPAARFAGSKVN